jgi:hypothetical protein
VTEKDETCFWLAQPLRKKRDVSEAKTYCRRKPFDMEINRYRMASSTTIIRT